MTAKDTITLPREVVEYAIAALESSLVRAPGGTTRRERDSITALRTALAAEQPKPVTLSRVALAWSNRKGTKFVGNGEKWKHEDCVVPLYAVERVDEPPEDIKALRRDAERYKLVLNWLWRYGLLSREKTRIDTPESYGDWWIFRKPKVIDGSSLLGYGKTEDAAIDAAMEEGKR